MTIHQNASGLASLGRHGDTMLVHMSPHEVAGLQAIAHAQGTSLSVNPHTGMPEAFSLGGFFKSLLPTIVGIGAGIMFPEFSPWLIGAGVGGITALAGGSPLQSIMAGIGAGSATGIGKAWNTSFGAGSAPVAKGVEGSIGAMNTAETTLGNVGGTGNLGMFSGTTADSTMAGVGDLSKYGSAGQYGAQVANTANVAPNFANAGELTKGVGTGTVAANTGSKGLSGLFDTANNAAKDFSGRLDTFSKELGGPWSAAARTGIPVLSALNKAGAFVPDPIPMDPREKYDPKRSLYLTGDSGLILNPNMEGARGGLASMEGFKRFDIGGQVNSAAGGSLTYTSPDGTRAQQTPAENYGLGRLNDLAQAQSQQNAKVTGYARGGYLDGPGDGMSDSIPASIEGQQAARLADGEFVIPADVVSHLGNGNSEAGAQRLYTMMDKIRKARTGTTKQGKQINPDKFMSK